MPQPISKLIDRSKPAGIRAGLPMENAPLCAAAMNVIALWAIAERDLAGLVTSFTPGKAAPIAALFYGRNAETPKVAIRNALAEAMLPDDERAIFDELMKRYDTCYNLRNPLAHWTLNRCAQLPDAIVAINPKDSVQISAEHDAVTDKMMSQFSNPEKAHLPPVERLSKDAADEILGVFGRHLDKMFAYKIPELENTAKDIAKLSQWLRGLRVVVKLRTLGLSPEKRSQELTRLCRELGLPEPMADSA